MGWCLVAQMSVACFQIILGLRLYQWCQRQRNEEKWDSSHSYLGCMRPKKPPNCTVSMWISLLIKFYHHNSALDLTNMHWYAKEEISKYFKDFIRSKCIPFPWVASSFPVRKYENLTEKKIKKHTFLCLFPLWEAKSTRNLITDAISSRKEGFGLTILAMFKVISTGEKKSLFCFIFSF